MGLALSNFAAKGELTNDTTLFELDNGYGVRFQVGITKHEDKFWFTKRSVWSNVAGYVLDGARILVPSTWFKDYWGPLQAVNPKVHDSLKALITETSATTLGGGSFTVPTLIGTAGATNVGKVATDKVGVFTNGTGEVATQTYDATEKSVQDLIDDLNGTTSSSNILEKGTTWFKKNWVYVAIGGVVVLVVKNWSKVKKMFK